MKKIIIFLLIIVFIFSMLSACEEKKSEETVPAEKKESSKKTQSKETDSNNTIAIVLEQTLVSEHKDALNSSLKVYKDNGYTDEQITIYDDGNLPANAEDIKKQKPDVVQIIPGFPGATRDMLADTDINIVVGAGAQLSADENRVPLGNITGISAFSKDTPEKLVKLIGSMSPSKGKKAIFINDVSIPEFTKDSVKTMFSPFNVKFKEFIGVKNYEETMEAAQKYTNDDEVEWVFIGVLPKVKLDGSKMSSSEVNQEFNKIIKKPTGTFYDGSVSSGSLCGVSISVEDVFGIQSTNMALEILNGKNMKDIKVQDPNKVILTVNKKTADDLNIEVPKDIIMAAFRVYTDYDGNFIGKK